MCIRDSGEYYRESETLKIMMNSTANDNSSRNAKSTDPSRRAAVVFKLTNSKLEDLNFARKEMKRNFSNHEFEEELHQKDSFKSAELLLKQELDSLVAINESKRKQVFSQIKKAAENDYVDSSFTNTRLQFGLSTAEGRMRSTSSQMLVNDLAITSFMKQTTSTISRDSVHDLYERKDQLIAKVEQMRDEILRQDQLKGVMEKKANEIHQDILTIKTRVIEHESLVDMLNKRYTKINTVAAMARLKESHAKSNLSTVRKTITSMNEDGEAWVNTHRMQKDNESMELNEIQEEVTKNHRNIEDLKKRKIRRDWINTEVLGQQRIRAKEVEWLCPYTSLAEAVQKRLQRKRGRFSRRRRCGNHLTHENRPRSALFERTVVIASFTTTRTPAILSSPTPTSWLSLNLLSLHL
eukprot:TRINITY_DN3268_c0_g1_i19.p1 TRINITY_DN3268_c0_g1~~TRINITY_DN3268_c0_g1_i19.p1  ORF type:complete len:409 (+),score=71.19 TRINITY_DN3268_c0_g1_i19:65-1291(+)